jgi:hypothetical protein
LEETKRPQQIFTDTFWKGQMLEFVPLAPKMLLGIAADHGGYELKQHLSGRMREAGHEVIDFGDGKPSGDDDYPDFILPLARAVRHLWEWGGGVFRCEQSRGSSSLPDPRELFGASRS